MTTEDVTRKVHAILVELLGVSDNQLTREAELTADLNAEELDLLDIEMAIEAAFNLTDLHDVDEPFSLTVGDLIDRVDAVLNR